MSDPRAPIVALVPARSPGAGKTRLADRLRPDERAALSGAMLADVTMALRASPVERVVVAAGGPEAAAAAATLGVDVVLDPPSATDLDDALRAAQARIGPVGSLLVVMADLPRLQPRDITALLDIDAQVVVAGTDDGGTGGLLRRPPGVIPTAYGPGSAGRHARQGRVAGARTIVVELDGFRHDVDTWEDLLELTSGHVGRFTASFLSGILARLRESDDPDVVG